MPRYHFDLVDHHPVEDHEGQILADDTTAEDVADELAARVYDVRPELRGRSALAPSMVTCVGYERNI